MMNSDCDTLSNDCRQKAGTVCVHFLCDIQKLDLQFIVIHQHAFETCARRVAENREGMCETC